MDIKPHMELAGRHLIGMLAPQWGYFPHFRLNVKRDYTAWLQMIKAHHNVGRWPDAMLRLEQATGFEIPEHIEAATLKNLQLCFDNKDHLLFDPVNLHYIQPQVTLHSCREGLLALLAHIKYRQNDWARAKAHKMLDTIKRISKDDGSFDYEKIDYHKHYPLRTGLHSTFTNGRLIEALVWYFQETDDSLAMELAERFANYHLAHTTTDDGSFPIVDPPPHTHSYLGTLRGLLLFGELTNQQKYIQTVKKCYDNAVMTKVIKPSGWTDHNIYYQKAAELHNPTGPSRYTKPEVTSCGDVTQLALWLARNGWPELLDDAERLVRCRLIPSQVTERVELKPASDEDKDEYRDLSERFVGALGGVHYDEPHGGKQATTDITCAVLHSLCDIYNNIVVKDQTSLSVQFHFDYENPDIKVTSKRDKEATLTVETKADMNLRIRVPSWAQSETVRFTVDGKPVTPTISDNFAFIPKEQITGQVVLQYDLSERTTEEQTDGTKYTCHWRGDDIKGIWPNMDFLPFYPTAEQTV